MKKLNTFWFKQPNKYTTCLNGKRHSCANNTFFFLFSCFLLLLFDLLSCFSVLSIDFYFFVIKFFFFLSFIVCNLVTDDVTHLHTLISMRTTHEFLICMSQSQQLKGFCILFVVVAFHFSSKKSVLGNSLKSIVKRENYHAW